MFYLKCREHKIPTPETILLSHNLNIARAELKQFGQWPVVLKRIYGTMGEFVERADNLAEAIEIIKKFQRMDCDKLPVIAQEFIKSFSYRVTMIDKKIVQTAIKKSKSWKSTGVYGKKFAKFRIDSKLKKILKKIINFAKINICGIDLLKKNGQWLVLEINTNPALDFIDEEHERLVSLVLTFLKKYHRLHMVKPKANKPISGNIS
jgi:glutathione synthase/RimK-type ligase-like ATP-grasp enzyme